MLRSYAFLALALALFSPSLRAEGETVDLILVAGQSNAVGFDAKPSELPADDIDKTVMFWWRCGDPPPDQHDSVSMSRWTHLQPQPLGNPKKPRQGRQYGNFAQSEGGFGPEIGLARTLLKNSDKKLAIVKAAFSGTGVRKDWDPNSDGPSGACYRSLVAETRSAIAAAEADGIKLRIRALAWVQGESDANATDAQRYQLALGQMLTALRKDLAAPEMICLLAVNTRFGGGKNIYMPNVIEAQQSVARTLERAAYVDTSSASIANNVHYDAAGTLEVGRMFAESLLRIENESK